jgi:tRNA(Ile)-lysidine synthase
VTPSSLFLPERIARTIREERLCAPGDTIIVAVSGGADSRALLEILATMRDYSLHLVLAHLNHLLRGRDSDGDEAFVRGLAAGYGIPCECRRVDVRERAAREGLNLEDAGRRERLAFFFELREKWKAAAVALAHHADDQAETLLMRLLRGSGAAGLGGMPYKSGRGIIRPLLGVTRKEIERFLAERGIDYRTDATNRDTTLLRNSIRHELLPFLARYNPQVGETLAATAHLLADEDNLLSRLAQEAAAKIMMPGPDGPEYDIAALRGFHPALQRRFFRHLLKEVAGGLEHLNRRHSAALGRLIASNRPNARLTLPNGITAIREYGRLSLKQAAGEEPPGPDPIDITGFGRYRFSGGTCLTIEPCAALPDVSTIGNDTAYFDLDRVPFPWQVRSVRPGDRISLLGMAGSRKVKNVFIDAKVPLTRRRTAALLFAGGVLIWICGLRRSSAGICDGASSRMARVVVSAAETR